MRVRRPLLPPSPPFPASRSRPITPHPARLSQLDPSHQTYTVLEAPHHAANTDPAAVPECIAGGASSPTHCDRNTYP